MLKFSVLFTIQWSVGKYWRSKLINWRFWKNFTRFELKWNSELNFHLWQMCSHCCCKINFFVFIIFVPWNYRNGRTEMFFRSFKNLSTRFLFFFSPDHEHNCLPLSSTVISSSYHELWFKLAPISPISNIPSAPPAEPVVSSEEPEVYQEGYQESNDTHTDIPSVLSTLPVALVVEQTARILEDIKRKIQQQKDEEERLRLEQQNRSESPNYFSLSRPIRTPDEGIFSASTTKSFVILNHRYSSDSAPPNNISPLNHTSIPRSLSPDSGTDYEPFSASSSISPPFLSTIKRTNNSGSTSDFMKLSHNSDDEIFKPLSCSSFSHFIPSTVPLKLTAISPTTSLSSIYSSARRLSGITMSQATTASLAKSTPSISTDLINETHQKPASASTNDHPRPLSFQVLQSNFSFDTKSFDTYHEALVDPTESHIRYKSLVDLPVISPLTKPTWSTSIISTSSQFSSLLNNNNRLTFGDPSAIKPIVSALEYPPYKLPTADLTTPPSMKFTLNAFERHTRSFEESMTRSNTLEKYNKFVEKQKQNELTQKQEQQADFLSLSLSPPMNRKNKDMPALKGCTLSLWVLWTTM